MYDETLADTVLTVAIEKPGLTLAKMAKTIRTAAGADAGAVRATVTTLTELGYLTRQGKGGRETYHRA